MAQDETDGLPENPKWAKAARGALQVGGGAIPLAGGLLSWAASAWSGAEQERVNEFLRQWIAMLQDELREKQRVVAEILSRLNVQDKKIADRVKSEEFQQLLKKAFRNWAGTESQKKQDYIRNILSNAASSDLTSDDVISLFMDWLHTYSEFHFSVIGDIYQNPGTTRQETWERIGKGSPREDSAEADLYRLLFRDLSTGGVIRQHRETDYAGNFIKKPPRRTPKGRADPKMKSAFDDAEQYELTALGRQFVHYAMTELTPKIEFHPERDLGDTAL